MDPDAVDQLFQNASNSEGSANRLVKQPNPVLNKMGKLVSLESLPDLTRATIYYALAKKNSDYDAASSLLEVAMKTWEIERFALMLVQPIVKGLRQAFPDSQKSSLRDLAFNAYAEYANSSAEDISAIIYSATEKVSQAWRARCEAHEDTLTDEQLRSFYNSFEFPIMCTFRKILRASLAVAQAALPLYLAQQCRANAAFDFGGNSGLMTTAWSLAGIKRVLLVEQLSSLLHFARWRDHKMNIRNVEYIETCQLRSAISDFDGAFEFGSSVEVLEHVADVEEVVFFFGRLLKKNGILFLSTSFDHYPYPTHLRRNVRHAGNEDSLLKQFGFERIEVTFPIPTRGNERVYRKVY